MRATGVGAVTRMRDVNPSQKKQILTARFEDVVLHKTNFLSVSVSVRLALACMVSILAASTHGQSLVLKTETFDADPGWDGRNNRATDPAPRQIVQNFGFNSSSTNDGGSAVEIGGFITPAGEPAFYGKVITPTSFNDTLSASGILNVPQGGGHTLIGFFNAG